MATEPIMRKLSRGGRTGVFLGAIAVLLVALFLPGWSGAIMLFAIVGALAWLMTKTWPVTAPQTRVLRVLVLMILAAISVDKIVN